MRNSRMTTDQRSPRPSIFWNRRAFTVIAWNALLALTGILLVAVAGEIYLRVKLPFAAVSKPRHFVKDVGYLYEPNAEVRATNLSEFWTITRVNSLGFLDREPLSPQRAAESCHIAVIGDSFVLASEVPIEAKFHVRLEHEARRKLPNLDVTTSAFGVDASGPVNQLPLYEHYVRPLKPKLLVLSMAFNDFKDSSSLLRYWDYQFRFNGLPMAHAVRSAAGEIQLKSPVPNLAGSGNRSAVLEFFSKSFLGEILIRNSEGVYRKTINGLKAVVLGKSAVEREERTRCLCCPRTSGDEYSKPSKPHDFRAHLFSDNLYGPCKDIFDFLGFALDSFQTMAQQDGASLVILATDTLWTYPKFRKAPEQRYHILVRQLAEARGIPVVDHYDYIIRQGGRSEDGTLPLDRHWNAQGHQWAAEALLEYLERNQSICDTGSAVAGTP